MTIIIHNGRFAYQFVLDGKKCFLIISLSIFGHLQEGVEI